MLYKIKTARTLYFPGIGYLTNGKTVELNNAQYEKLKRRCGLYPVEPEALKSVVVEIKPAEQPKTAEIMQPKEKVVLERSYEGKDILADDDEEEVPSEITEDDMRDLEVAAEHVMKETEESRKKVQETIQAQQQRNQQMNNGRPPKNKNHNNNNRPQQ